MYNLSMSTWPYLYPMAYVLSRSNLNHESLLRLSTPYLLIPQLLLMARPPGRNREDTSIDSNPLPWLREHSVTH
jgi:hypothetical protein